MTRYHNDMYKYQATLVGSLNEGTFLARLFKSSSNNKINREFDVDVELTIVHIKKNHKHCVRDIREKPGYVNIKVVNVNQPYGPVYNKSKHVSHVPCSNPIYTESKQVNPEHIREATRNGFLNPRLVKKLILKRYNDREIVYKYIERLIAYVTHAPLDIVYVYETRQEITKATAAVTFLVNFGDDGENEFRFGIDCAPIIRLMWTPQVIIPWMKRKRNWTALIGQLKDELSYGYVILKTSHEQKNNEATVECQYSFAYIERKIVSLQSGNQRLVYFIFKSIIYKHLIAGELDDQLSSYISKTTMLWACDRYPPDDPFWALGVNKGSIFRVLSYLFADLLSKFREGVVPYYFIPQINIIEDIPMGVRKGVTAKLELIKNNVEFYMPKCTREVREIAESALLYAARANNFLQSIEATTNDGGKDFVKNLKVLSLIQERPDLFLPILDELHELNK